MEGSGISQAFGDGHLVYFPSVPEIEELDICGLDFTPGAFQDLVPVVCPGSQLQSDGFGKGILQADALVIADIGLPHGIVQVEAETDERIGRRLVSAPYAYPVPIENLERYFHIVNAVLYADFGVPAIVLVVETDPSSESFFQIVDSVLISVKDQRTDFVLVGRDPEHPLFQLYGPFAFSR